MKKIISIFLAAALLICFVASCTGSSESKSTSPKTTAASKTTVASNPENAVVGTWEKSTGARYTFESDGHMSVSLSKNYDSSAGTATDGMEITSLVREIEQFGRVIKGGQWEYTGKNNGNPTYSLFYNGSNFTCVLTDNDSLSMQLKSGIGGVSNLTRIE